MRICTGAAIVLHRRRQEVKLNIRIRLTRIAFDETACLEMIGRTQTAAIPQPLHAYARAADQSQVAI